MSTVRETLAEACRRLAEASPSPRIDADCLLQHLLKKDRAWLRAHDDASLNAAEQASFDALLQRRLAGEPIAYITGERGFWSLELAVASGVLIPRADTETLVEWALELIAHDAAFDVLDLGTGSGAIALAIKRERPRCRVCAVDKSAEALAVAKTNARRLQLDVEFRQGDWFAPCAGRRFDVVLSNPPYIAEDDPHLECGDLRFEPRSALAAGEDGLSDLRHIVAAAPSHLLPGGWLLLEHGYQQGEAVRALLAGRGFTRVETRRDLGGQERITGGCYAC